MKIVVCVKQVPDTADIKWTENNSIQREGMESVINPFDEFAIETALKIKDKHPLTEITAISMGPLQTKNMLKRIIAYGIDRGILLSDKKFAGADTYATAKTLSLAIKNKIPNFDLIICGQFATDGDTGQTGPAIASFLGIPQVTYAKKLDFDDTGHLFVTKETESFSEKLETEMPTLICMSKSEYHLRPALIDGYIKAHHSNIEVYNADDIGISPNETGFKGSPTYVSKAFCPEKKKSGIVIQKETAEEYAFYLDKQITELKEKFNINE